MATNQLRNWILKHEGLRKFPYYDTVGVLTIGVGRNLESNGLREEEIFFMLDNDIQQCIDDLQDYDWYSNQPEAVQNALINMRFNLGMQGLLTFKKMIGALQDNDYTLAAKEALNSKWASQVKGRAIEVASMLRHPNP